MYKGSLGVFLFNHSVLQVIAMIDFSKVSMAATDNKDQILAVWVELLIWFLTAS